MVDWFDKPRMTLDVIEEDVAIRLSQEEVGAMLRELDRIYVRGDAMRSALLKLNAAYPDLCPYCRTDIRVGLHAMARCVRDGTIIKRENE